MIKTVLPKNKKVASKKKEIEAPEDNKKINPKGFIFSHLPALQKNTLQKQ
jgi:hypothetical protein